MDVIMNINDLSYIDIFNNLTINIEKNRVIQISAKNNSGKTTLTRILDRKIQGNFNIIYRGKNINEYSLEEYNSKVQVVYPLELNEKNITIWELLNAFCHENRIERTLKELKIEKFKTKRLKELKKNEQVLVQIAQAIINSDEFIIIDNMDYYLSREELARVYTFIKNILKEWDLSFIIMSTSLEEFQNVDELYILQDGKIILHGEPLIVLEKDNMINKAGLSIPFIIDLSVKLKDYDLINHVELDQERLIDTLWN